MKSEAKWISKKKMYMYNILDIRSQASFQCIGLIYLKSWLGLEILRRNMQD